jgi:hypothetical protein
MCNDYASKKWAQGLAFERGRSDYDFLVCDSSLFQNCEKDVEGFAKRVEKAIVGSTPEEVEKMQTRLSLVQKEMARGFIDDNRMLPNPGNPTFQTLIQVSREVSAKYRDELGSSRVKLRVYRDWDVVMAQNVRNLRANLIDIMTI